MLRRLSKSIRFKIMIALLAVITAVVSAITFTMGSLFHADKKTYVSDVSALVAAHVAAEANTLIDDTRARLESYARVIFSKELEPEIRNSVLRQMADDFPDLVILAAFEGDEVVGTSYDADALEEAKLDPARAREYLAGDRAKARALPSGGVTIGNSTMTEALPTFTMILDHSEEGAPAQRLAMAVIRVDGLMRLVEESKAFNIYLLDPAGVMLAHRDAARVARKEHVTHVEAPRPGAAAEARTYASDGGDVIGGVAATHLGNLTAVAELPESVAYFASRELLWRLAGVSLVLLMVAAVIGLVWSRKLTGSIRKLADATHAIGEGRFDVQVEVQSDDEIGTLAGSFNRMASELDAREKQLQVAQAQLIQSEKMAAFGQLGAGFAHEIKNPLAGILGLVQINMRRVGPESPLRAGLETMEKETKRCKAIIDNLLKFARQEKVVHEVVDLRKVLDDAAAIMRHQLGIHQVQLHLETPEDLPRIHGNANQLQQVLMNLMLNAQQAMKGQAGQVWIAAERAAPGRLRVRVRDDGPGIPKEIQQRIFEPFFTTKPSGEGTGLGLSVTFGIIKDHDGEIRVESEPGKGTTFWIDLPAAESSGADGARSATGEPPAERAAA